MSIMVVNMFKSSTHMIKGLFIGMISGLFLGSSISCIMRDQRKVKRKASRAIHAVGDFIDQVPYMFKQ